MEPGESYYRSVAGLKAINTVTVLMCQPFILP
jgi:hypothetical protein